MSDTGRFFVKTKSGRVFCVEPIDETPDRILWGDYDPASKKMTGNYGSKHRGSIKNEESIITEKNGFVNITMLPPGENPLNYIDKVDEKP